MVIKGTYGEWFDRVEVDGRELRPDRSLRVRNHSPDGFAWGYAGSGPSQLALAILLQAGLPDDVAQRLHQRFKGEFIQGLPHRGDFTLDVDVKQWAARQELA